MAYHDHSDFEAHEKLFGHPANELPLAVREAYVAAGMTVPQTRRMLSIHTPPGPGFCAHCGVTVPKGQHAAAHAVAGFEDAHHPESGEALRMLVNHCDEHWRGDHCSRDNVTPGSGWNIEGSLQGAAGWCEPIEVAETLAMGLIPGAPWLARNIYRLAKLGVAGAGLWLLGTGITLVIKPAWGGQHADASAPAAA